MRCSLWPSSATSPAVPAARWSRSCGPGRKPGSESCSRSLLRPRRNRRRRRSERLLDHADHLFPLSLDDRKQPTELESRQLDVAGAPQRLEAEVRQEVRRKDCLVHLEALVLRFPLAVAVRKRLERLRTAIACVADRREEERLHHPRARGLDEIRA